METHATARRGFRHVRSAWLWSGALVGAAGCLLASRLLRLQPREILALAVVVPLLLAVPDVALGVWLRRRPASVLRLAYEPRWLEFWLGYAAAWAATLAAS